MTYEVKCDERIARLELKKNINVNNRFLYKVEIEKECCRRNDQIELEYTLDLKCFENGVNIQVVLPHEVLSELKDMIEESLIF